MNILFVCKHNRFRSRVAEAYFNKIKKNKNINSSSAGIFQGSYPLDETEINISKEFGIDIDGKPRTISSIFLSKQDLVIIVADDVSPGIFDNYNKKVEFWGIPDDNVGDKETIRKIIKLIVAKVDELEKRLK